MLKYIDRTVKFYWPAALRLGEMEAVRVIDTDTHVSEPADLWTSRVPARWHDAVPQAIPHPKTGYRTWRIGDTWLPEEGCSRSRLEALPANSPRQLDDEGVDPGAWRPKDRLERMDAYGIYAQVLYPNIIGFYAPLFMRMDPEIGLACVRAYNDFITEFASDDPARLLPITMLPFWDIGQSSRWSAAATGPPGNPVRQQVREGRPSTVWSPHWDRVYAAAQEMGMPVNFHVAIGENDGTRWRTAAQRSTPTAPRSPRADARERRADRGDDHERALRSLPRLNFVSVESGFGYVPYLLDSLDWQWMGTGAGGDRRLHAERVLPAAVLRHVLVRDDHARRCSSSSPTT